LHVQGCLILSQVGLLFHVNRAPKKMESLTGFAPVISCMRGRHVVWLHHRDRNGEGRTFTGNLESRALPLCALSYGDEEAAGSNSTTDIFLGSESGRADCGRRQFHPVYATI
jgi:hypothetical protein